MFGTRGSTSGTVIAGAALALGIAGLQHGFTAETAGAAPPRPVSVQVTLRDFKITMSRRNLPAGRPITFVISNRGQAMHEVVLEQAGADDEALEIRGKKYEADDIAPGTTRTVTWTLPHAARYQLACHMPGHFQMGMKTIFTVARNT